MLPDHNDLVTNHRLRDGGDADEIDDDSDGWVECAAWSDPQGRHPRVVGGGDCDDNDRSRSPRALELCNRLDDDCDGQIDDGVDLDADGFTTPCDCNDSDAATHPNADEICNHLDENCNGEPDDGFPWGPVLREVNGTGNFGHSVADVGDVDGDGRPDFVVGSPTESPGGRVRLFSGASRELLCETPDPAQAGGGIGTAVIGLPDLDGDRIPDFAASAPRADRNPPLEVDNGAVVVFSGRDCQPIRTCWPGAAGERAGDRSGLAAYGSDILVGLPFHDEPGAAEAGGVVIVSSRNCSVSGVLTGGTAANPRDHLGWSVASVPSVDHDGVLDIVAGAPHADAGGTDRGEVLVFSGADGRLLHRLSDVVGNDGALFGHAVVGIGDVNADGAGDIGIGEPKAGVGNLSSAGRALVFSGRTAARLASFDGQAQGDQLGYALAVMPARPGNHDHTLLAGAPYVDHASGAADAGRVVAILALDGSFLGSVERAQPGRGEPLGFSVWDRGDALGLGSQQLRGGARGVNTALIIRSCRSRRRCWCTGTRSPQ